MGAYKYINKTFQEEYKGRSPEFRGRLVAWRSEPSVSRIAKPTNIARARELGYKAKQGVVMARVRVRKGLSMKQKPRGGRKPSKSGRYFAYHKSEQAIAEERAARAFNNCEALNSYFVGEDGNYKFFEVILIDRSHPSIESSREYSALLSQRGRAYRGLTSSGRKHRGIVQKGFGTNKNRPSIRANTRQ